MVKLQHKMNTKNISKLFGIFTLLILVIGFASAVNLAEWSLVSNGNPTAETQNVNAGVFTSGPGISNINFGSVGASTSSWPTGALESDSYFQTSISPQIGSSLTISSINFGERRSGTGITNYEVQWSKSSSFTSSTTLVTKSVPDNEEERDANITGLNIIVNSGETLFIRWLGYNAETSLGTWRINDNTLVIEGIVSQNPSTSNLRFNNIPSTVNFFDQNPTITLTNTGTTILSSIRLSETSGFGLTFNPISLSLNAGATSNSISLILSSLRNLDFGFNTINIKAEDSLTQSSTTSNFQVKKTFCSNGETPNTNITIDNIKISNHGEGGKTDWELLDEIEVEVKVRNNDREDEIESVIVMGLFDSDGADLADDLEFTSESDSDEEEIEIDVDERDSETVQFVFRVPADFEDGNYKLAIKVYDDDRGENVQCDDTSSDFNTDNFYHTISIDKATDDGKLVIIDDIRMDNQATCSETVSGSLTVFNVGEDDQDRVKVLMKNLELGVNQEFEIINLDEGDEEDLSFNFRIPPNAANKLYPISFRTMYEYDDGIYEEESDDEFLGYVNVLGCTGELGGPNTGQVVISASIDSQRVVAGQELKIKSSITNLGQEQQLFVISSTNYNSWADLVSITPSTVNIGSGDTEQVDIILRIRENIKGTQEFKITVTSNGQTTEQEVQVSVGDPGFGFNFSDNNSLIWVIAIINLILIILIIVVAVRLARK